MTNLNGRKGMNIYVANIPYSASNEDLQALFEQHGEVASANIIMDRATGRSKGFGFVEMTQDDQGEAAISALDGSEFQGRNIKVNKARPRAPRD